MSETSGSSRTVLLVAMEDALLRVHRAGVWTGETVLTGPACRGLAFDPHRPGRVYLATADRGVLRSADHGRSWSPAGGIDRERVTAVAVSRSETGPGGEGVVWAGTEPSGVFRSEDGGEGWEERGGLLDLPSAPTWSFPPRPHTHHVRWIAPDPRSPGRIFVAIEAGALVRSEDGGRTWRDRVRGGPRDTHTLVMGRRAAGGLHAAAGDGYFESDDGGDTWRRPEDGLEHRYVWGCALPPGDPDTVLVSAAESARRAHDASSAESWIYRRTRGSAWVPVREGLPGAEGTTVSVLAADPAGGGLYAANNRGLHRSGDAGVSWTRLDVPWPGRFRKQRVAGLAVDPAPPA